MSNDRIIPKLSDSRKMRSAKYLRIKSLQKTQAHPQGAASIFGPEGVRDNSES